MDIKINGLTEPVLIQLIDNGFKFKEIVRSSAELLLTDSEKIANPERETTYYISLNIEFIGNEGNDLFIIQPDGNGFQLPMSEYDSITIL